MVAVTVERDGPVTTVILDRREVRNAVNGPTATLLAEAFLAFERDDQARVAVLWGAGGTFCAGADLKSIAAGAENTLIAPTDDPLATDAPMGPTRMRLSKPVIAAIEGHAVAGGLELACWCDLRVAAEDAVFGVFCRRWGVPLVDGGTVRLPRIVGHGRAMDMILTGRPVDAAEALTMGLVNRVVPRGRTRQEAEALARHIASFPQGCLTSDRMSTIEQWDLPHQQAMANEFDQGLATIRSGETVAGSRQFRDGAGRGGRFDHGT